MSQLQEALAIGRPVLDVHPKTLRDWLLSSPDWSVSGRSWVLAPGEWSTLYLVIKYLYREPRWRSESDIRSYLASRGIDADINQLLARSPRIKAGTCTITGENMWFSGATELTSTGE